MSPQPQDADVYPRIRPRSNTTTFQSFSWRRNKSEAASGVSTTSAVPLSLEALIESLSPPSVPSLNHARSLAALLLTCSPLPRLAVLNPILASLCASTSPASLQSVGYDIVATYWDRYDSTIISADRLTYFSLFQATGGVWSAEIWEPRLRALRVFTKSGNEMAGIEASVIQLLKNWIGVAFDALMSSDTTDLAERAELERGFENVAAFLGTIIEKPVNAARISQEDFTSVLQLYISLIDRVLSLAIEHQTPEPSVSPAQLDQPSPNTSILSRPPFGHKRHASSLSIRSLPSSSPAPPRPPVDLIATVYLNHINSQIKTFAPDYLPVILPVLFRCQAFFAQPLHRLSLTSKQHVSSALDSEIQRILNALFTGPYSTSCMMILRRYLFPPIDIGAASNPTGFTVAIGAHRTLRNYIRQGLFGRLARAYISRSSSINCTPSGTPGQMDLERELMERAWSKDDVSGLDLAKLGLSLCRSIEAWINFHVGDDVSGFASAREKIVEEAAGTMNDIFQEFDSREEGGSMDDDEVSIVSETFRQLIQYVRLLKNPDGTAFIILLSSPSDAPTPLLSTLASLLARDHSPYMTPSLSRALLSLAEHLSDHDLLQILVSMYERHDLSPTTPEWLENWKSIFMNFIFFSPSRSMTRLEVMKILQALYDSIRDMRDYRVPLAELVVNFCEGQVTRVSSGDGVEGDFDGMWRILGDEAVHRIVEEQTGVPSAPLSSSGPQAHTAQDIIAILTKAASDGPDWSEDSPSSQAMGIQSTHTTPSMGPSAFNSPFLSRMQSDFHGQSRERDPNMPSVLSLLTSLAGNSSRSQSQPQELDNVQAEIHGSLPANSSSSYCVGSVVALINVFSQLAFTPYSSFAGNLDLAVQVFNLLVQLLSTAKNTRARATVLQFFMRLRADRDHRVYYVDSNYDPDGHIFALASLVGRVPDSMTGQSKSDLGKFISEDPLLEEFGPRNSRARVPQERFGRRASRGRGARPSQSNSSRSRSRVPVTLSPPAANVNLKPLEPLWHIPEKLPFTCVDESTPSEGLYSYDSNGLGACHILPVSTYLAALVKILESERNWDILSYVLCHLPVQLANKHLFCGPNTRQVVSQLLTSLCTGIAHGDLASSVTRWPPGLKPRDAHGIAFHTLTVLIGYRRCFDGQIRNALVEVLVEGLSGQPSTTICCLHALSTCAFELSSSLKRYMPEILVKLSQIMSNPDMAVHIISFLCIVGSLRELQTNFREEDYKMVFGVALQYLQHHNRPEANSTMSWALSQYVRTICFYVVYLWFLAVKLPDRSRHIPYIVRQLLLANEGRSQVDEPTEVCFDWLARYTYASADPRPANSTISEIVMNPSIQESSEMAVSEKTWILGNSVVTVRALARLGWLEVLSRRPSGFTKFLCKSENTPLVGPGDVNPDMVSIPASLMLERDIPIPDSLNSTETRETILIPHDGDKDLSVPDPITGYVWSGSAPSQRRKHVDVDPSYFALQLSSYPDYPNVPYGRRVLNPSSLPPFIRMLDRIPVIDTHKVGIMYVAPGQTDELDILRNTHGSPAYTRFLEGIGRLIHLRGQLDVYAGGLNPDEDGEYAYAWWDDIGQILYHTATMMPSPPDDQYCINKKRHIGNDYVRIVWNDSGMPYRFDTLSTQFQFVNIVIEPHSLGAVAAFSNNLHENEYFKVTVQRAPGMREFTPIGAFKLISAENLPPLMRQLSLLADWFATVFERTERDTAEIEVITNWRSRLQSIRRFKTQTTLSELPGPAEGIVAEESHRNFTTTY